MHKEKNTANTNDQHMPSMKVVETSFDQAHIEMEIERHVKSIKSLITKLRPLERQRYFDGLLSHILDQPVEYPGPAKSNSTSFDYCNLSVNDLSLIRELSVKIHELYRITESE
jgi:hypothetical protein